MDYYQFGLLWDRRVIVVLKEQVMRKHWQLFIISALLVFVLIIAIPFTYSQEQVICQASEHPVSLGGKTLFCLDDKEKDNIDILETKIRQIAEDFSIQSTQNIEDSLKEFNLLQVLQERIKLEELKDRINQYRQDLTKYTVFLDNKPIFIILSDSQDKDPTGSPLYSREKRATIISERIKKIAPDPYIDLKDIEIEKGKGGTTNIVVNNDVIVTLTDDDVKAAKVGLDNKQKLAKEYRKRIRESITIYRKNHPIYEYLWKEWIKPLIKNILIISIAIIIIIVVILVVVNFIIEKSKSIWKNNFNNFNSIQKKIRDCLGLFRDFLGLLLQILIPLLVFALILKFILIFIAVILDSSFPQNLVKNGQTITEVFRNYIVQVLQIISWIFLLGIISLLLHWLSDNKEGIVILPFEDTTGGKFGAKVGKAIADSLVTELVNIHKIGELIQEVLEPPSDLEISMDVAAEKISFGSLDLLPRPNILDNGSRFESIDIGAVEVGPVKFTVEPILLFLRQLWPFGGVSTIISGSLQTYNASDQVETRLVVILNFKNKVTSWEVSRQGFKEKLIPEMIRDLAFKTIFIVAKQEGNFVPTWERLKDIIESINDYYKYFQNGDSQWLVQADTKCQQLIKNEQFLQEIKNGDTELHEIIQTFYYKIGYSYFLEKQYSEAEEVFDLLSRKFHKSSYYNALGNTFYSQGKYELARDQYERSIRINKDNKDNKPEPHIGLGSVYAILENPEERSIGQYNKAINIKKEMWQPYYNKAKIYLYHEAYQYSNQCYEQAKEIIKESLAISQNKNSFYLHTVLGLAYLFQVVYENRFDNKGKLNNIDRALESAEKAAYLAGEVDFIFWNLGLTRLVKLRRLDFSKKEIIDAALSAWKTALALFEDQRKRQSNKKDQDQYKYEKLKKIIYKYTIDVFTKKTCNNVLITILLQEKEFNDPYYGIRMEFFKKDLEVICKILEKTKSLPQEYHCCQARIEKLRNILDRS